MHPRYRLYYLTLFLLLPSLAMGCQKEQSYGVVEGVVTLDGKPLTNVEVVFMPDPEKGMTGRRSTSLVDQEGRYRITSDMGRPGAPVGIHRVCITDLLAPKPGTGPGPAVVLPEDDPSGADTKGPIGANAEPVRPGSKPKTRFPAAYGTAFETPFHDIEVKEGSQVINLELKRK